MVTECLSSAAPFFESEFWLGPGGLVVKIAAILLSAFNHKDREFLNSQAYLMRGELKYLDRS